MSVHHATFTIERKYKAAPAKVFAKWSTQSEKAKWFGCVEGWSVLEHTLDFRAGGREVWRGGPPNGPVHENQTTYFDIVPEQRIVYAYAMSVGGARISVSLATLTLEPDGPGTKMIFTEQGTFFTEGDAAKRERGTQVLLANLEAAL